MVASGPAQPTRTRARCAFANVGGRGPAAANIERLLLATVTGWFGSIV